MLCHVSNWFLVFVIDLGIGFWYGIWEGENFHRTKRIVIERMGINFHRTKKIVREREREWKLLSSTLDGIRAM